MIKTALIIASTFVVLYSKAQNIVVLDNTPDNQAIFDTKNPLSFVSLVKSNSRYLGYMELEGMSPELAQEFNSKQQSNILSFIGQPGTVPLIDDNPESPNFGNNLIYTDPTSGQQSFVYDAPDTIITMLTNIDRIALEYPDGAGSVWERLKSVTYYKKHNDTYHPVMRVNAQELLSFDGFSRFIKLDGGLNEQLTASNPNSLWNVMRKEALTQLEKYDGSDFNHYVYDMKHRCFPGDAIRFGFFDWSDGPVSIEEWEKEREVFYPLLSQEQHNAQFPFGMSLGNGLYRDTTGRAALLSMFENVYSDFQKPSKPLKEKDPNSPNFGEYLLIEMEDGSKSFVYDPPKEVYFWLDYSNVEMYVAESFHAADGTTTSSIDAIYFTKEVNGIDEVISVVPMKDVFLPYFADHTATTIQALDFYSLLQEHISSTKDHFNWNNKKDRKTLKME